MSVADKLKAVAENVPKVYEAGKKAEYDAFWDSYQNGGKREGYAFAFAGKGWNAETFRPKYDIIIKGTARSMFAGALLKVDLEQALNDLGLTLDTSGVTSSDGFDYFIEYASPSVLPTINTTGVSTIRRIFTHSPDLVTVRKLVIKGDGSQTFSTAFSGCTALENLVIEGVIGQNGLDLHWSTKLSRDSIVSVINALSDMLPQKIIEPVVELSGIDPRKKVNSVTREERIKLTEVIKHFRIPLSHFRPIDEAIVTKGGISVKEISPKTMESKLCTGLFFAGEVIDLDAYTGGFNLQIAFSTGVLAGESAAQVEF